MQHFFSFSIKVYINLFDIVDYLMTCSQMKKKLQSS